MASVGYIHSKGIKSFLVPVQRPCGICGREGLQRYFDMEFKKPLCRECTLIDIAVDFQLNSLEGYRRPTPDDTFSDRRFY